MQKGIVLVLLCLPLLFFTQCGKKDVLKKSSVPDEAITAQNKYTAKQIAEGKVIYQSNCGKCHELHEPAEFKAASWDNILPRMGAKAHLTSEQAALVRAWVITNAKAE